MTNDWRLKSHFRASPNQNGGKAATLRAVPFPRIVIPSAAEGSLLHGRKMRACALSQTTPWCFLFRLSLAHGLPPCKKDPSTSSGMTRKKDGLSHIVFYSAA